MNRPDRPTVRPSLLWLLALAVAALLFVVYVVPKLETAASSAPAPAAETPPPSVAPAGPAAPHAVVADDEGVVTHLVDGDTLDVRVRGAITRIRLLNVDTPETKKPNTPVQCMGPQASARLAQLAPLGSTVRLTYDIEPQDQYGRTLAAVILANGENASVVLAREGLGVPIRVGPNTAGYAAVVAAQSQAKAAGLGLYSGAC